MSEPRYIHPNDAPEMSEIDKLRALITSKDAQIEELKANTNKAIQAAAAFSDAVTKNLRLEIAALKAIGTKWIWVAEELPERGKAVLVHTKSGVTTVAYLLTKRQAWQVYGESGSAFDADDEIHYWMPLPLAPADGNKEAVQEAWESSAFCPDELKGKPNQKTYLVQFFDGTGKEKGRAVSVAWSRFEAMIDHKAAFDPFASWDASDVMELNLPRGNAR